MASVSEELRKRVYGSSSPSQSQINAVQEKANTLAPGAKEAIDRHNQQVAKDAEQRKKDANPSVFNRLANTLTGALKGSAADYVNTAGVALTGLAEHNYKASAASQKYNQAKDAVQRYQSLLRTAKTDAQRKQFQSLLEKYQKQLDYFDEEREKAPEYQSVSSGAKTVTKTADSLAESSAKDIQQAKKNLGGVGSFLIDTGVAGTQLAGDVGLALLTGGSALAPMAVRSFGGAAQEARQQGGTLGEQVAYGLGSAALSVGTEKIANVSGVFQKAFGKNTLASAVSKKFGNANVVKAINGAVEKMNGSLLGRTALSAFSEGGEEVIENAFQPVLQNLTYADGSAKYDQAWLENTIYQGLVGGALGGVGAGVVDPIVNKAKKATSNRSGAVKTAGEVNNTPVSETKIESSETPILDAVQAQKNQSQTPVLDMAQQVQTQPVQQQVQNKEDPLLSALLSGKRVEQSQATNHQFYILSASSGNIVAILAHRVLKTCCD